MYSELIPTEEEEQQALFRWLDFAANSNPELRLMIHIPNEGKRTKAAGARLKSVGLRKGVPDLFLPIPKGNFHGLWIEMKRVKGSKTSKDQKEWIEALKGQGYFTAICFGWLEAKETIERYMKGEQHDA